ncbi:Peptidase S10 [Canna indica]|uniref:Peptidase S10 n=1 Tax=Canna indica TaxID=4628 RepID=A0AAQ3KZ67_9LILI|nr:Peptidase S10 [Canna indica]
MRNLLEMLGVGDIEFVSSSSTVYQAMTMDWMRNLEVGIPALLDDGIKLLETPDGFNLWSGLVHDAGHLVPMDQPKASLEMLRRWTTGKLPDSSELGLHVVF